MAANAAKEDSLRNCRRDFDMKFSGGDYSE